ncbi:O-methyltransferase [Pontibacillus litoralis]|uniref:tRNA 5-hydroxyuridine methyltransferase n=1 Tax=Pontibacillus litoralis JSM 072002 TaxID=1385512 RepID=A0A0A5GA99_9BACI|nr:O-methyltransferase [Pontibacillus litoralis]KGX88964.1 SAM-dependent methyltransferase [Pontibacillus litoralis JSM 072002]
MLQNALTQYLSTTLDDKDELTKELEAYAAEHRVPIMEPLGMEFVQQIIRLTKPTRILEIGTAIGYSAIQMARSYQSAIITTIERDEERYKEAIANIQKAGLEHRINVILGDALQTAEEVERKGPYDALFIDAAKGQYQRFFELYTPFMNDTGVVLSDNVLFKGYVADNPADGSNKAKVASKIKAYNEWLVAHPQYKTTIIPIGDGVAISVKR